MSFVDPKGLRNVHGFDDPKVNFYKEINKIESSLSDSNIVLNSFIISNTHYRDIKWWSKGSTSEKEFAGNHVLFQKDARDIYIGEMFRVIEKCGNNSASGS